MNKQIWKDKILRCALAVLLVWCALYTAWMLDVIFSDSTPETIENGGKHDRS